MSELQISLIVIGVIVILAVVAYNWWQDRRVRQKMQKHLPVVQEDPLLGESNTSGARREPGLGHLGLLVEAAENAQSEGADSENVASTEPDPLIEEVIELVFSSPKTGGQLLEVFKKFKPFGQHSVRLFVQDSDGSLGQRINPDSNYLAVHFAVLIANRSGPLTAIEWSQIWGRISDLAEDLEARVEGPDHNEVVLKAESLDATCASFDMQVGLNLILEKSRPTEEVIQCAKGMGFVMMGNDLAWVNDQGIASFTLHRFDGQPFSQGINVDKVSLILDVPRSPVTEQPFTRMMEVGAELARRLGAVMVDDQGKSLVPGAEAMIDERLQDLYEKLEAAGLPAGSERARRVFA